MEKVQNVAKAKSVFVSWNSKQKVIKDQVCDFLERLLNPSKAPSLKIEPSTVYDSDWHCSGDIKDSCGNGIKTSSVYLLLCSDSALNSEWVNFEIECAEKYLNRNYIVPVFLNTCLTKERRGHVGSLASGVEIDALENEKLKQEDLEKIGKKVQTALNEHVYQDYLARKIDETASTMISLDYENSTSAHRFNLQNLYVERTIQEITNNGEEGKRYTEQAEWLKDIGSAPVLVFGKSGTGKSTLIDKIVYDELEQCETSKEKASPLIFSVKLKDFAGYNGTLTEYLYETFKTDEIYGTYTFDHFASFLKLHNTDPTEQGEVHVFFDAIDEILDDEKKKEVEGKIQKFFSRYTNTKAFFTARSKDEKFVVSSLPGQVKIKTYRLEEFDEGQEEACTQNLFAELQKEGALQKGRSKEEFQAAVRELKGNVKSNPFIFTQLVLLYNKDGREEMPRTLSSVYGKAMDYYLRRDEKITSMTIDRYEEILEEAAYRKYCDAGEKFDEIFRDVCGDRKEARAALEFFRNRSVLQNESFFYQVFHEYYVAKYIFENAYKLKDKRPLEKLLLDLLKEEEKNKKNKGDKDKKANDEKDNDEKGNDEKDNDEKDNDEKEEKWHAVGRIFLSMAEDKGGDCLTQALEILVEETNYDFLFQTAEDTLTNKEANRVLVESIYKRTITGEFGWHRQLCYYVPVYGQYAYLAKVVANQGGEPELIKKSLCILRDICFIYGAWDKAEEIEGIEQETVGNLQKLCREAYRSDLEAFDKGKAFSSRTALNFIFFLGMTFEGKEEVESVRFEGKKVSKENILNNFSPVYPREFCVIHAINRQSKIEAARGEKARFVDEEGLIKENAFGQETYVGLVLLPYKKEDIESSFQKADMSRFSGLILLPSWGKELVFMPFPKEKLFYYSFPDTVEKLGDYCFNFCRHVSYFFLPGHIQIGNRCFENVTKVYLYLESGKRWRNIFAGDNLKCALYRLKASSLKMIGNYAFYDCSSLALTKLSEELTEIGQETFCGCTGLTKVEIPSSVMSIGDNAFAGCTGLKSISLPRAFEADIPRIFGDIDIKPKFI